MSRRITAFEFNDLPCAPIALKELIIETLGRGLAWGGILAPLAPAFQTFLEAAQVHDVLDLCSGAGGPAHILAEALGKAGHEVPRFTLTDLLPQVEAWTRLHEKVPQISFVPTSVDLTAVPHGLSAGKARLIINALHHFAPELAQRLFADAVAAGAPIFIAECFERQLRGFVPMVPPLLAAHLANPFLSPRRRLWKILLAWLTPIGALAGVWDGFVSTQRVYSEADLRALVAPLGADYAWTYGNFAFPLGGKGYYFYGLRRDASASH